LERKLGVSKVVRKNWLPRRGQVFDSKDSLLERLLESGWEFEGCGAALDNGREVGYDVGVTDKDEKVWIIMDMEPVVRITKVKKMKLPYRG